MPLSGHGRAGCCPVFTGCRYSLIRDRIVCKTNYDNQVESVQEENETISDQDNGQLDEDDKESESDEKDTGLENNDGDQTEASISTISLADIPAFDTRDHNWMLPHLHLLQTLNTW